MAKKSRTASSQRPVEALKSDDINTPTVEPTKLGNKHKPDSGDDIKGSGRAWYLVFTESNRWIALFTAVLTAMTGIQLYASMQTERAIVSVDALTLYTGKLVANEKLSFVVRYKNSGGVEASIQNFDLSVHIFGTIKRDYGSIDPLPLGVLPPASERRMIANPVVETKERAFVPQPDIDLLADGKNLFLVWGSMTYRDSFSFLLGEKTYRYCFRYVPELQQENNFRNFLDCPPFGKLTWDNY